VHDVQFADPLWFLVVCLQVFYRERAAMMYDPLALGIGEAPDSPAVQTLYAACPDGFVGAACPAVVHLASISNSSQMQECTFVLDTCCLTHIPIPVLSIFAATILAELPYVIAQATVFVPIVSALPWWSCRARPLLQ
jgi:hypothetical protein